MSDKVVIDIEARLNNKSSKDIKAASKDMEALEKSTEKAIKALNNLAKMKIKPHIDLDDSKFSKRMKAAEERAKKFVSRKFEATLSLNVKAEKASGGVAAILGVKSNLFSEGMNMGRTFSNGFKQGIERADIGSAIGSSVKNYFTENPAAPLILGEGGTGQANGNAASGSGADTGGNLLSGILDGISTAADVIGVYDFVKSLTGSKTASKIGSFMSKNVVGTAAAGSEAAMAAGSAGTKLGGRVVTGGLLKGTTMSAGMASGLGLAGAAGGVLTVAGAVDGASDLYKGYKADNEYDKKYYKASGATKLGGTAAGAAVGTMIMPGLGTLIGGGIGYLAGKLSSDKVAENYAGGAEAAKEYAESSEIAAQKTEELKQKQAALAKTGLEKAFGKITLSSEELDQASSSLFDGEQIKRINSYTEATDNVASSYKNLQNAESGLKKGLFMSNIKNGAKMTTEEIENLKLATKTYGDSAKQFITDSQYASNESVTMLLGNSKAAKEIMNTTNDYYAGQQKKLDSLTSKLSSTMESALRDGKISMDEEKSINKIRSQIAKITSELAKEEFEVNLEKVKMNISDGNLTPESFADLISSAQKKAEEMNNSYETGAARTIHDINKGKGTPKQKEKQINQVKWGDDQTGQKNGLYKQKTDKLLAVGNTGLDGIKNAFRSQLGVLGGDISNLISTGLTPEVSSAISKLGQDGETRAAIGQWMEGLKPNTEELQKLSDTYKNAGKEIPKGLTDQLNSVEFYNALSKGPDEAIKLLNAKKFEANPDLAVDPKTEFTNMKKKAFKGNDFVEEKTTPAKTETKVENKIKEEKPKKVKFNPDKILDKTKKPKVTQTVKVDGKAKPGKKGSVSAKKLIKKNAKGTATVKAKVKGKSGKPKKDTVAAKDAVKKKAKGTAKVDVAVQGKKKITNKISVTAADFGVPNSVKKTVQVNIGASYGAQNKEGEAFRGGIFGGSSIRGFADGGFVQGGTQLATLAEEGTPEAVIPLGTHRRKRAMELFDKVGQYLKVPGYAAGGIAGGSIAGGSGSASARDVNVGGVEINIHASGGQSLLEEIREHRDEIADEIAGAINNGLSAQYENMPARG